MLKANMECPSVLRVMQVKVYVEDDVDVEPRLCRQWVREGRCERGRGCKYSHKHSLVGHGLR